MTMSSNNLQGAPETTQTHTAGWLMTATSYNLQNSHGRVIRDYVVLQLTACSRNYSNSRGRPETTQTNMAGQLMTAASYNLQRAPETTQTHRATKNTQKFTKNWKAKSTCDYVTCDYVILQLTETYKVAQKHGHIVFTSVFVGLSVCQLKKLWMKFRETFERWTFVKFENLKMLLILTTPQQTVDMFLRTLWGLDLTFNSS